MHIARKQFHFRYTVNVFAAFPHEIELKFIYILVLEAGVKRKTWRKATREQTTKVATELQGDWWEQPRFQGLGNEVVAKSLLLPPQTVFLPLTYAVNIYTSLNGIGFVTQFSIRVYLECDGISKLTLNISGSSSGLTLDLR